MKIVGVGIGPGMLTAEAAEIIRKAEVIYGSPRAIKLVRDHIRCKTHHIEDYSKIYELPNNAVVLSTGDPNLSGLGKYADAMDTIIPGISSLQVACARLKIDHSGVVLITAHGRDPNPAAVRFRQAITSGATIFLLPAPDFSVREVSSILSSIDLDVPIAVLEQLGYPDERVSVGSYYDQPSVNSDLYCIMVGPDVKSCS